MSNPTNQQPTQLSIELPLDLEATYSNMALISHSVSEVILPASCPTYPRLKFILGW